MSSGHCRAAAVKSGEAGEAEGRRKFELADVVRRFGDEYRRSNYLSSGQSKALWAIEHCRTARLGGHKQKCDQCGYVSRLYNSCLNRHCPKCQFVKKARWLAARESELLPVGYFHNVFTQPHHLNGLVLQNRRKMYDLLFSCCGATLLEFAARPRHGITGRLGITALLHTWDQLLQLHPHIHCVVTGGTLSSDGKRWTHSRADYLFCVKALSKVFRGKYLNGLKRLYENGELKLHGSLAALQDPKRFGKLINRLYAIDWAVYSKPPFGGPQTVLKYLNRYTHRVAISNHRILNVDAEGVTFSWRDRRNEDQRRTKALEGVKFLKRFMLHALPRGYVRIRYFGFMGGSKRKQNLETCRRLLNVKPEPKPAPEQKPAPDKKPRPEKTTEALFLELTGKPIDLCPRCGKGRMIKVAVLPPITGPPKAARRAAS